jgi:NAD(P)-dependent dehydrogenase (short-subunit alcohol dehydrogenase family)
MFTSISGRSVLVAGGTKGIGKGLAAGFAAEGARVVITGRDPGLGGQAEQALGPGARFTAADAADPEAVAASVRAAVDHLGGLDVLVNNAGVGGAGKPFVETTAEEWDATVNINLRAVFFCTRYAVPALLAAKGSIVNVASILGLGGRGTGLSLYCASKGGVVNLTRDLAIELAPDIRVNCVCPGAVDTEMLQEVGRALGDGDVAAGYAKLTQNRPMQRVARAAEIANAIVWLASDLASFTTGAIQVVDGGVMAKAG